MKSRVRVRHARRILCVFPRYAPSFGTFQHAYPLMDGVRAFMPPQGILVVAAYLPGAMAGPPRRREHPPGDGRGFRLGRCGLRQRHACAEGRDHRDRRAGPARLGKASVLGGPSVSACPEEYPQFDYLHLGEIGDATDALIRALDDDPRPPPAQRRFATAERLPLADFPLPAYHLIEGRRYFLGSVQFSSGCPYRCEFCDIPALYGRQPRLKQPRTGPRRARCDARRRHRRLGLFRRRQFHRQQEGGARAAAASDRLAEAARLSGAAFLRGDAQHRRLPGHPGDDARGLFLHGVLRHRDARSLGRSTPCRNRTTG